MSGLWYKNADASITQEVNDGSILDGEDIPSTTIWSGRVYIYPLSARAKLDLSKVQIDASHQCYGVPQNIELHQGDVVTINKLGYRIQSAEPTFDGPLGSTGWNLLLRTVTPSGSSI